LLAEEQPVGTLEAALVERLAVCLWRLRRAVTAESASLQMLGGAAHAIDTRA
jgi:hypothetical protein